MALQYTTEYGLGRRGKVSRTCHGPQALIAITFDLALALVFGLIGLGLRAVCWCVTTCWRAVRWCVVTVYRTVTLALSLPLRAIRAVCEARPGRRPAKPAWTAFDDL